MARKHLFADEAGDFEFARKPNVSRYFIVCTVTMESCDIGHQLLDLRRDLAWRGNTALGDYFHACEDNQCVRDEVFRLIEAAEMRIDATILEKSKARPHTRASHACFYQYGWYYHFRSVSSAVLRKEDELLLTAASLGRARERRIFTGVVNNVVQQVTRRNSWATFCCPAIADPCLQVADYCTWAIQRKWERHDVRSYDLIRKKIVREYELWSAGTRHYY
jgi:hypothetical protein